MIKVRRTKALMISEREKSGDAFFMARVYTRKAFRSVRIF
jgi:hypothetical protein